MSEDGDEVPVEMNSFIESKQNGLIDSGTGGGGAGEEQEGNKERTEAGMLYNPTGHTGKEKWSLSDAHSLERHKALLPP